MTCTACGHANPAESSFCLACGRPLIAACAQCGMQLPADARFCNKCGASVSAPTAPPVLAAAAPGSAEVGERRQLTVLVCDLVGSTPLSDQLDAEEWRDLLARYQRAARTT